MIAVRFAAMGCVQVIWTEPFDCFHNFAHKLRGTAQPAVRPTQKFHTCDAEHQRRRLRFFFAHGSGLTQAHDARTALSRSEEYYADLIACCGMTAQRATAADGLVIGMGAQDQNARQMDQPVLSMSSAAPASLTATACLCFETVIFIARYCNGGRSCGRA